MVEIWVESALGSEDFEEPTDSNSAIVFDEADICSRWISRRGIVGVEQALEIEHSQ